MPPTKIGVVTFKADTGNYLARCNGCMQNGAAADSAFVHVTAADLPNAPWARFEMWALDSGLYAFKADSGNYLGRCNGCAPDATQQDPLFVHVTEADLPNAPWAQFQLITVPDRVTGKVYTFIKGDNGLFVGRVRNGIPTGAYPDSAFVYVRVPEPITPAALVGLASAAWQVEPVG